MNGNEHKLDFQYTFGDKKFTLRNCDGYVLWRCSRSLFNAVHDNLVEKKLVGKLLKNLSQQEIKEVSDRGFHDSSIDKLNTIIQQTPEEDLNKSKFEENNLSYIYRMLVNKFVQKTDEYHEVETSFQQWLKTRPGVLDAWKQYARKHNKTPSSVYAHQRLPVEPSLYVLSNNLNNGGFRKILENNRPEKFLAGQVVRLKDMYRNKRGKDPYYYKYGSEYKNADRVGTVLKKEGIEATTNYGIGSREIRVLWFFSGEESHVAEKCLSLVKSE